MLLSYLDATNTDDIERAYTRTVVGSQALSRAYAKKKKGEYISLQIMKWDRREAIQRTVSADIDMVNAQPRIMLDLITPDALKTEMLHYGTRDVVQETLVDVY